MALLPEELSATCEYFLILLWNNEFVKYAVIVKTYKSFENLFYPIDDLFFFDFNTFLQKIKCDFYGVCKLIHMHTCQVLYIHYIKIIQFLLESGLLPSNLKFFADIATFPEFFWDHFVSSPPAVKSVAVHRIYQASFYHLFQNQSLL